MHETCNEQQTGSEEKPPRSGSGLRRLAAVISLLLVLGAIVWWRATTTPDFQHLVDRGHLLVAKGNPQEAIQIAEQILADHPQHTPALLLAAEAEFAADRTKEGFAYLEQIADDGSEAAIAVRLRSARLYYDRLKQLEPAEDQIRRALDQAPDNAEALGMLIYLLGLESRNWESAPYRIRLFAQTIRERPQETVQLFSLGLGDNALENPEIVLQMQQQSPHDPGVQLGTARIHFESRQFAPAAASAREAAKGMAHPGEAFARWGYSLVELNAAEEFEAWNESLTPEALAHPGVWYARGQWALAHHRPEVAARCLWETVKRNSAHQKANYETGQVLAKLGHTSEADAFLNRSLQLEAYLRFAEAAHHAGGVEDAVTAGEHAEKLGLLWEAYGWAKVATTRHAEPTQALALVERLEPQLEGLPFERAAPGTNPAEKFDFSRYPAEFGGDRQVAGDAARQSRPSARAGSSANITFADIADDVGLHFEYRNAGEPKTEGLVMMYEVVGGGVGVLDYDGDGRPDLWFAQGSATFPPAEEQHDHLDELFRLQADGSFRNVTAQAGVIEPAFSQGVGVGDINGDGFPDVYVPNIGGNRLFINNGDGTFSDDTPPNIRGDRYSACALVADINGDNWPDIYEVNYLAGDNLFTEVCGDDTGYKGACHPQLFDGSADQLYFNLGNGEFENVSQEAGIEQHVGKGLGIVAWHSEPGEMLHLFVANDVGPNFLFVNQAEKGERPRFVEQGLISGLALNRNGKFESSMGIAAGDYDNDGRTDFFVTNFDNETNTLYRQQDSFLFADATVESNVIDKREPYVGWGAQFIDADLDGWGDLIFTNGHVNDLSHKNRPFRMPAQVLRNEGNGTFAELRASRLGPYFRRDLLGRGLARLDWNDDGREDTVVTHLDAPAALLQNTTDTDGRYLAVELRGVQSSREAIGAIVRVKVGESEYRRQLTAGDGNQVSNQRRLVFGLGAASPTDVAQVTVSWPAGTPQVFDDVPVDRTCIALEGAEQLVVAPSSR